MYWELPSHHHGARFSSQHFTGDKLAPQGPCLRTSALPTQDGQEGLRVPQLLDYFVLRSSRTHLQASLGVGIPT